MQREEFGFHRFLVARAGDADLLRVWLSITSRLWHGTPLLSMESVAKPMRFYEAHRKLLEAIASRESDRAIAELEAHIKA
jgi:DNA-binding GntR family transcriptional regulator